MMIRNWGWYDNDMKLIRYLVVHDDMKINSTTEVCIVRSKSSLSALFTCIHGCNTKSVTSSYVKCPYFQMISKYSGITPSNNFQSFCKKIREAICLRFLTQYFKGCMCLLVSEFPQEKCHFMWRKMPWTCGKFSF